MLNKEEEQALRELIARKNEEIKEPLETPEPAADPVEENNKETLNEYEKEIERLKTENTLLKQVNSMFTAQMNIDTDLERKKKTDEAQKKLNNFIKGV